jgi:hypothetical protein
MAASRRLVSGLSVLDSWSRSACQADRNVIYEALFAVVDGSVFAAYDILDVLDETGRPPQFYVRVRDGLGTRIRMHRAGGFGIVSIGAREPATGAAD